MSVSSEVKRTLVKSPPELWSELGDLESLARHLGDVGEIQIKRTEPERALDWEADGASGSVRLEPSGFGTKVTLSLTREPHELATSPEPEPEPEPEPVTAEPPVIAESVTEAPAATEPTADQPIAEAEPAIEVEPESESVVEAEPEPERRRGFFARLFGRKALIDSEPAAAIEADEEIKPESAVLKVEPIQPEPIAAEPEPTIAPEPTPGPEPVADVAVDLAALEAQMSEQDEALLTAILDRLGAAHHRPFSRS